MQVTHYLLKDAAAWSNLQALIAPAISLPVLSNLCDHLKAIGARCAILEHEYLDQDFTSEFSQFYSKLFKRHTKLCRRLHFFSDDLGNIFEKSPEEITTRLDSASENGCYLGFIVVRPVRHAPIGFTVLAAPADGPDGKANLLVRSKHEVHLLGTTLNLTGVPFMQQDSRTGACAQASIWMAGRHFHTKHRGPWMSVAQITEHASVPADQTLAQSLPAGSGFLNIDNMIRALRAMGREPFAYVGRINPNTNPMSVTWPSSIRPKEIIHRYVDSGIPVILGLAPWVKDTSIGHAVTAVGHHVTTLPDLISLPANPTRAEFANAFLVNDDQLGTSLRMPTSAGIAGAQTPYSVERQVYYILIPLPGKVFLPAESAETIAWNLVNNYETNLATVMANPKFDIGGAKVLSDEFKDALKTNTLIARTYLTYGWKYKRRILRNICSPTLKAAVFAHDLPRFVWVTEFGICAQLNYLEPRDRRILGHVVIDATSNQFLAGSLLSSALFFHAPGFIIRWSHNSSNQFLDYAPSVVPVPDEVPYYPKVRGHDRPV